MTVAVNLPAGSVSLHMIHADPLTACLLGSAGKGLVKPLIECFDRDIQKYLACLKGKGLSVASDIASCAAGCFVPAAGGASP